MAEFHIVRIQNDTKLTYRFLRQQRSGRRLSDKPIEAFPLRAIHVQVDGTARRGSTRRRRCPTGSIRESAHAGSNRRERECVATVQRQSLDFLFHDRARHVHPLDITTRAAPNDNRVELEGAGIDGERKVDPSRLVDDELHGIAPLGTIADRPRRDIVAARRYTEDVVAALRVREYTPERPRFAALDLDLG